jgi:competence CoiA-like predicted nuclease
MLTAIHQPTKKTYDSIRSEETIIELRQQAIEAGDDTPFICKLCGEPVNFRRSHTRAGFTVVPHFYHLTECTSEYRVHPESREHITAKAYIAERLPQVEELYQQAVCEIEYRIPQIKRIADIAFLFPDGEIVIHEIQLSVITERELQERTRDYVSIGAQVIWHLGPKMRQHEQWCKEALGVVGLIDFYKDESAIDLADRSQAVRHGKSHHISTESAQVEHAGNRARHTSV